MTHFVDEDEWVLGVGLLQTLDDLAGHGAHVGASVALDLGHVTHAPHAESEILHCTYFYDLILLTFD